jgi:5-formyltetrahydrofolate cyclo-ligase
LLNGILAAGKACYLPVLDEKASAMTFARYQHDTPLKLNRYGINEPMAHDVIDPQKLDLVLLPLLGFDKAGHRLGMGGGFYDKTFAFLAKEARPVKPLLLGVAYAVQECDDIPTDSWDVLLDGVVIEHGVRMLR